MLFGLRAKDLGPQSNLKSWLVTDDLLGLSMLYFKGKDRRFK